MSRPGSLALLALQVFSAAACHPEVPPAIRVEPTGGVARCALAGTTELGAGTPLYQSGRDEVEVARFSGGKVGLVVDAIEARARAHVVARVPAEGPALTVPGFIDDASLALYAVRDLPIAGRSLYIAKGARISVRSARDGALRVTARYTDFPDIAADARCEDLALSRPPAEKAATPAERGKPHHLAREHARIFERAHGEVLADLKPSRPAPTFDVDSFKRGLKHVRYEHGIVIDAWMNAEDLEEGSGPDCDHCYGGDVLDVDDRCPGHEHEDVSESKTCPPPPAMARTARDVKVLATPRGPEIGVLEGSAEVYVPERKDGLARIIPTRGWLYSPAGGGFWVESSALSP